MNTAHWLERPSTLAALTLAFALVPVAFAFITFQSARERDTRLFDTAAEVLGAQVNLTTFRHVSFANVMRNQWRLVEDTSQPPRWALPPGGWHDRFPHMRAVAFVKHEDEAHLILRWQDGASPERQLGDNLVDDPDLAEGMKRARLTAQPINIGVRLTPDLIAVIGAVTGVDDTSLVRGYLIEWLDLGSICRDPSQPLIRNEALRVSVTPMAAAREVSVGEGELQWKAWIARGAGFTREYDTPTPWLGFGGFALSAVPLSVLVMLASRAGKFRSALKAEREVVRMKTHFLHSVSHEFRTPLSVIQSGAELIEHYADQLTPERRAQALAQIKSSTQHMNEMVEQVLTLSRLESGTMQLNLQTVNVGDLCRSLADDVRIATHDRCPIEVAVATEDSIEMDPTLVRPMLVNTLTNAVKYSTPGERVLFYPLLFDGVVRFSVVDRGIGILPADKPKLGQPFFRGENVADIPGTGLGLAIMDRCAKLHGAEYGIHSQEGNGTQVVIVIRGKTSSLQMLNPPTAEDVHAP
ncbi:MAG: sensor histidine kinase [Verrucomicrobiaceae bacterium]